MLTTILPTCLQFLRVPEGINLFLQRCDSGIAARCVLQQDTGRTLQMDVHEI